MIRQMECKGFMAFPLQLRQRRKGVLPDEPQHSCADTLLSVPCRSSLERGFSMISAIFLLIVIAALGTFAVTLSTTQQQSALLDAMGSRAYQAARTGIEWGAYQLTSNPAGICSVGGTSNPVTMPIGTLAAYYVDVSCWSYAPVSEAASSVTMYRIISTASGVAGATVGSSNYVERNIVSDVAVVQ